MEAALNEFKTRTKIEMRYRIYYFKKELNENYYPYVWTNLLIILPMKKNIVH